MNEKIPDITEEELKIAENAINAHREKQTLIIEKENLIRLKSIRLQSEF